jgi:hypothetical protein
MFFPLNTTAFLIKRYINGKELLWIRATNLDKK